MLSQCWRESFRAELYRPKIGLRNLAQLNKQDTTMMIDMIRCWLVLLSYVMNLSLFVGIFFFCPSHFRRMEWTGMEWREENQFPIDSNLTSLTSPHHTTNHTNTTKHTHARAPIPTLHKHTNSRNIEYYRDRYILPSSSSSR